jgi:hypothetical protein
MFSLEACIPQGGKKELKRGGRWNVIGCELTAQGQIQLSAYI